MTNVIEIKNLTKHFDGFSLEDVSFHLPIGFIMGLVGKNGAGKTTTIKLLLELLKKDSGTIHLWGKDISEHALDLKQDIAVVFDDTCFVDDWDIKDVESAIAPFYIHWDTQRFHELLHQFHLPSNKKIKNFSKGMRMKVTLAAALSHQAKLLILDEPTSGLDPVARDELLEILMRYIEAGESSVLFSSHITTDLDRIADYITILNNGHVIYSGLKDELYETYFLAKGGLSSLTPQLQNHAIGMQQTSTGFSALLHINDMKYVTPEMVVEKTTIDEIMIFTNKEVTK